MKKLVALYYLIRSDSYVVITDKTSQARIRFSKEATPLVASIQINMLKMISKAIKEAITNLEENYGRYERGGENSSRNKKENVRRELLRSDRAKRGKDSPQNKPRNRKSN